MRILLASILLAVLCSPAVAQQVGTLAENLPWLAEKLPWLSHMAMTVGGVGLAMRWAYDAFGRREVSVANVPTFPQYMTNPQQYRLGSLMFVAFAGVVFLLLVYRHEEVVAVVKVFGPEVSKQIIAAVETKSASYLFAVAVVAVVYLYCLKKEADWNLLLMMRDAIHSWISIPQLAGDIVAKIQVAMKVPPEARAAVVRDCKEVVEADFEKRGNTPDRVWAETCYMKQWLEQAQDAGEDTIFFAEQSFGFKELLGQFDKGTARMRVWKSGEAIDSRVAGELVEEMKELDNKFIRDLRDKFARLVACYLIYRNASNEVLRSEANKFGIVLRKPVATENPLRLWIVYILALMASVYLGVYVSGIAYDLFTGVGFNIAQDPERVQSWILYSFSNYGVAIVAVLLLRVVSPYLGLGQYQTHLITYCWTFAIAFLTGPFGLAVAAHMFGPEKYQTMPLLEVFYHTLKWGPAPALVAVYISYYLDRQTCHDLPAINHSPETVGWRLLNCIGFAAITLFVLLPPLLTLEAQPGAAWDTAKLRFVASGTAFFIALGLAVAAQFALREQTEDTSPVLTPRTS
jgi:hypothetical protein